MSKASNAFKSRCKRWNNEHPDDVVIRDKQIGKAYRKIKRNPNWMLYTPWESARLSMSIKEINEGKGVLFNPFKEES